MRYFKPISVMVVFLMTLLFTPSETFAMVDCGGCTDPEACNFNPAATEDDGTCVYTPECFLWAADDILCVNEDEMFEYNVLCNDGIGEFPYFIEAQNTECFSISEGGQVIPNNFGEIDCCGEHIIPYTIFFQGEDGTIFEPLQAVLTITVKCGKPDCSIIDLESMLGDIDGTGTLAVVRCFDVCENSVSTLQFPFNPLYAYDWVNVVGGVGNPGANPAELLVSWNSAGTGFVTLDVYDANGVVTTYNFCVNILDGPQADCTSPGYVCLDSPICFTNLSTNADGYHWDFGDGNTSTMSDPCHTYSAPGIYTVTLTATKANYDAEGNPLCCCTDIKTATVEVDDLPGPNIYWVSTLCEGDNSDYWTDAMNCATYVWTVLDADGNMMLFSGQGTSSINVTWGAGPVGTVSLQVTGCDDDYCSNPTTVTVPIIPSVGEIDGPTIVCEYTSETYCLPKWQSTTYDWSVTGGTITSSNDGNCITVSWGPMGVGTIHVDFWSDFLAGLPNHSAGDCMGSADLEVNIVPTYTLANLGLPTVCIGDISTVQAFSTPNPNCTWTITPAHPFSGDGSDQITINWTAGGTYVIEAFPIDPSQYCNGPESIIIQVQDIPAPTAIDGPISVCPGTYYYSIPSPDPSVTYFWSASNGNLLSTTGTTVGVDWFNVPGSGTLSVYAQSNSSAACQSPIYSITVDEKVINLPLDISPGVACSNTTSNHTLTPAQDADAIITWSVSPVIAGSVLVQNDANTQILWNDWSGTAQLTVEVELCGNTETHFINVPVNQPIVPVIVQTGVLCPGVSATLSTTVPFTSYAWSTGDPTPTTSISAEGNYSVTTVDSNGCTATSSFDANEVPGPTAAISTGDPNTICITNPHVVTLIAQFNANNSYQWYCDGNLVPGATNATFDHPFQGTPGSWPYWVVVTDNNTLCMSTSTTIVVSETFDCGVPPCETGPYTFDITTAQNQFPNCNVIDFETTLSNASFSQWIFDDGNFSGSNPTSHAYTTAGCYYVVAHGTVPEINGNGVCSVSDATTVCVPVAADFDFGFVSCTKVQFNEYATYINTDPANTIVSYNWDFDGFGSSSAMNPCFDFALPIPPGNHPVTLTVTTAGGCQASITYNVFIDSVGASSIAIAAGPTCVGDPINMSAFATGATEYTWDFGDLATFVGASTAHTYTTAGSYTISVTSSNAAGCFSTTSVPITIHPAIPDLAITANPGLTLCQGQTTVLTAPAGYSYLWSNLMTSQSITVGAGTYDVLLTDANGCISQLAAVEVVELPLPNATISGNPFICDAGCTTLSVPYGFGFFYQWYDQFGTPLGNANTQSVCTPLTANQFFVEVTDQNGCMNVSPPFDVFLAPSPFFSVSVAPSGCAGEPNTLSVIPVQPGVSYVWSNGEVGPVMTTTQAGTYYVTGTDDNTGCSYTSQGTVNPLPNLCLAPVGCYTACDPYEICAPAGYVSYQWNKDGLPIPGATLPCYTATMSGTYTVTVMNNFGCEDTSGLLILEIIPCNDCDSLFVDFTPTIIDNEPSPCCFDLHYDNGFSGPLQGMSIYTSDADLAFDPSSVNPLLTLVGNTSNLINLGGNPFGTPIPTGVLNNVISLCLENVVNSPQTVYIDWYDFDNEIACQDSLIFECPVEPDCLYLQDHEIYCEDGQTVYNFTVCNPHDADWPVGYFSMDNITPGSLVVTPSSFTPSPAIAPGSCQSFTAFLSGPNIGGDVFCYNLIAHDFDPLQVDTALCCSLDTLYCIDIPPCDPCDEVGVFDVSGTDPDDCCLSLTLFNNFSPSYFDEIMICSVSPSTTVTVNNFLGSGWITSNYTGTSFSLIPDAMFGNFVPGGNFTLPEICMQTNVAPPQLIEIKWMSNGEVVCTDMIENFCEPECGYFVDESIECGPNTWDWSAYLKNTSNFPVSEAVITFNDPALSAYDQVISTGTLLPGQFFGPINMSIGAPAFAGQTICFTVTLHELGSNGQYLSCCNFEHCITLPDCGFDIECVCDENFYDAVQQGFSWVPSGGPYTLGFYMTNSTFFGECDLIYWKFGDGSPMEVTTGLQSILHTYPGPGVYTVCIKVVRTASDGTQCSDSVCLEVLVLDNMLALTEIIDVYPNPNNGDFKVAINQPLEEVMNIDIYDGTQRLVESRTVSTSEDGQIQDIDLREFEKGIYYVHFRRGEELYVEKVIIF